jgi:hypothetical protein
MKSSRYSNVHGKFDVKRHSDVTALSEVAESGGCGNFAYSKPLKRPRKLWNAGPIGGDPLNMNHGPTLSCPKMDGEVIGMTNMDITVDNCVHDHDFVDS